MSPEPAPPPIPETHVYSAPDLKRLAQSAAALITARARQSVSRRGRFAWALAGGRTPVELYAQLARPPWLESFPWKQTQVFWSDERCVPPLDPASNYRLAKIHLLDHVPIPPAQVHPWIRGAGAPESWAAAYELELRNYFTADSPDASPAPWPAFDLILLGLGRDGHCASLFPHDAAALAETRRWTIAVDAPFADPPGWRMSLSLPAINSADHVVFLVAGAEKKDVAARVIGHAEAGDLYPAARVSPRKELVWFADEAALGR